jgi:two-component system response regulator MprA
MGRVLLVDHDWFAREPLALFAQSWSHEVEQANDAAEALEKLTSFRPHVMVTNRGLPGPDGEELVRMVRQLGDTRTFIICLTGYTDEPTLQRVRDAGCDLVLTKPVDTDLLQRGIAEGCARGGA